MTTRPPPAIAGVLETCLYARELAAAASFYEEVLGLEPFSRADERHVFFRCGSGVFLLFNPDQTNLPGGDVPPHGASGAGHVAFSVPGDELPAWRARLDVCGVAVEAEIAWPSGGSSLYLRDPAGNSVELANPSIWGLDRSGDGRT
ncbi:MAG: VOC family protein [Gemmatimonadota bacterium]